MIGKSVNRSILDSIADYVLIIDKDYKIIFANKALLQLCECAEEEDIIGKECHNFSHHCSIPCFKEDASTICSHHEIFETGKPVTVTHTHKLPDNTERVFEITSSPVRDEEGKVIQIIEILRDVTAHKRAEEVLKKHQLLVSVFDSTEDGVVVVGRDYKIISANKSYLKQQSVPSLDEIIGRHCYEVSHRLDKPCFLSGEDCSVKNAFETGTSHWIVHRHLNKDGNPIYVETESYPMKDDSGSIDSVVEIIRDISDKRQFDRALEKRVKELEEFYEMTVARELKMIELKEEIERLKEGIKNR
jgi:PAS domain S-box-containing protein